MEMMKTIKMDQNEIVDSITKLRVKPGDIVFFHIKTDDEGIPIVGLDTVQETVRMMSEILGDGVRGLFLVDKICLFSVEDAQRAIEQLELSKSYVQEAIDKVRDIKNGNSAESFVTVDLNGGGLVKNGQ